MMDNGRAHQTKRFSKYPKGGFNHCAIYNLHVASARRMQWRRFFTLPTWPTEIPYGVLQTPHWVIGPNERSLDALRALIGRCGRQSTEVPRWRWLRKHGTGAARLFFSFSPPTSRTDKRC